MTTDTPVWTALTPGSAPVVWDEESHGDEPSFRELVEELEHTLRAAFARPLTSVLPFGP